MSQSQDLHRAVAQYHELVARGVDHIEPAMVNGILHWRCHFPEYCPPNAQTTGRPQETSDER